MRWCKCGHPDWAHRDYGCFARVGVTCRCRKFRLEVAGATYLLAVCPEHAARVKEELKQ
jgi:hypothetical protein